MSIPIPAKPVFALILSVLLISHLELSASSQTGAQKPDSAPQSAGEKAFAAGNKLAEAEKYPEALAEYKKALAEFPDSGGLLWNAGTTAYFTKDYALALSLWSKLKKSAPEDDAVRAKLIQLFQAQGNAKALKAERDQLVALRKSKKNAKLSAKPSFCCDQFTAAGKKVFAYDFFELSGDRALRYNFLVLKPDGTTDYRISVGSYKDTNSIAHELGEIKANQRLFHLDGYYDQGHTHKTFQFYLGEPTYNTSKKDVIAVLEGKVKAQSGSTNLK